MSILGNTPTAGPGGSPLQAIRAAGVTRDRDRAAAQAKRDPHEVHDAVDTELREVDRRPEEAPAPTYGDARRKKDRRGKPRPAPGTAKAEAASNAELSPEPAPPPDSPLYKHVDYRA